jgi:hypothetical protein
MITQKTAERIWKCHREIEASHALLSDMEVSRKEGESFRERPLDEEERQRTLNLSTRNNDEEEESRAAA